MKLYSESPFSVYFGQIENPYLNFISEEFVISFLKGRKGNVLDLGCGAGRNTVALAKLGYAVIGIDNNPQAVKTALKYIQDNHADDKVRILNRNILHLKKTDPPKFDYCILQEVVEHVVEYNEVIEIAYDKLKKNGVLILTTQYNPRLWNRLDSYSQHTRRFTREELLASLRKFRKVKIIITGFPFIRMAHFLYESYLRISKKEHSTDEFVKNSLLLKAYVSIFPYLMKFDRLFDFTCLGRAIIAYAVK